MITGTGRDPVIDPDVAVQLLRGRNRGGRPRKDGSHADTRATLADAGISKRTAARMRAFARLTDEEFEASLTAWSAEWERIGREPSIERFISKRGDNTRLERETDANMARLDSTLRRIESANISRRSRARSSSISRRRSRAACP
jgi:hypothetical protein